MIDPSTNGAELLGNALRFVAAPTYQKIGGLITCQDCLNKDTEKPTKSVYEEVENYSKPVRKAIPNIYVGEHRPTAEDYDKMLEDLHDLKEIYRQKFRVSFWASQNIS